MEPPELVRRKRRRDARGVSVRDVRGIARDAREVARDARGVSVRDARGIARDARGVSVRDAWGVDYWDDSRGVRRRGSVRRRRVVDRGLV